MKRLLTTFLLAVALVAAQSAVAAEKLTIWGLQAFNQQADARLAEMAKAFGKARGIDVEYIIVPANVLDQRLAAAFEGKAPPDVFMQVGQKVQYYANLGLTEPLDDILAEMRAQAGGIYESVAPQAMFEGKAHSLPLEVDVIPMFVRKDLVEQVGMKVPTTWEEVRAASVAIIKKNPQIAGLGMAVSNANDAESDIRMLAWCFGGAMFGPDGKTVTWNSPETRAAYQFIADMYREGSIPKSAVTWDDSSNNTAYQTGRAAFILNPPSVYSWMVENDKQLLADTVLINIPKGPGEKGRAASTVASFSWLVSKTSPRKAEAKAWLSYFFKRENYEPIIQVTGGRWVPIYPELTKTMDLFAKTPAFASFDAIARNGQVDGFAGPPTAAASEVYAAKIATQSLQQVLVDGKSVADAVAWAQAQIEAVVKKQK